MNALKMPVRIRWLAAVLLLAGCGGSPPADSTAKTSTTPALKEQTSTPNSPTPNPSPSVRDTLPLPSEPADLSLTVQEYEKLGVPTVERLWNSGDLAKAAKVLAQIARDDAAELPRYGSPKSGKVFARITSDENLDQIRAKAIPAAIRMGFALQFMQACSSVSKSYASGMLRQKTGGDEAAELVGLNLRIAVVMSGIVEEFMTTLDKKDSTYSTRLSGLKQMKAGMSTILQSAIMQASEPKALKPETLDRLLKAFDTTFPALFKAVPPSVRKETLAKLRELSEKPEYASHRTLLDPILEKLSQTIEETSDE